MCAVESCSSSRVLERSALPGVEGGLSPCPHPQTGRHPCPSAISQEEWGLLLDNLKCIIILFPERANKVLEAFGWLPHSTPPASFPVPGGASIPHHPCPSQPQGRTENGHAVGIDMRWLTWLGKWLRHGMVWLWLVGLTATDPSLPKADSLRQGCVGGERDRCCSWFLFSVPLMSHLRDHNCRQQKPLW